MPSARKQPVHPVLVIHGGTGGRPAADRLARIRRSLNAICEESYRYLQSHSAVEAVSFAVRLLEDDPLFNAGTGSVLQRDGRVRMSASIMDGSRALAPCSGCGDHRPVRPEPAGRFAAVLNIERVRNPVLVAKALLDRPDRVLAGPQATQFARSLGIAPWNPATPERLRQWQKRRNGKHGTVGAVALDHAGRLAAATSTGGKGFEQPGRVSDSGTPAGNFANDRAAITCTGLGEEILDEGLAVVLAQRVADGLSISQAFRKTFREAARRGRHFGAIGLDWRGRHAWATTLPMLFAVARTRRRWIEAF